MEELPGQSFGVSLFTAHRESRIPRYVPNPLRAAYMSRNARHILWSLHVSESETYTHFVLYFRPGRLKLFVFDLEKIPPQNELSLFGVVFIITFCHRWVQMVPFNQKQRSLMCNKSISLLNGLVQLFCLHQVCWYKPGNDFSLLYCYKLIDFIYK